MQKRKIRGFFQKEVGVTSKEVLGFAKLNRVVRKDFIEKVTFYESSEGRGSKSCK